MYTGWDAEDANDCTQIIWRMRPRVSKYRVQPSNTSGPSSQGYHSRQYPTMDTVWLQSGIRGADAIQLRDFEMTWLSGWPEPSTVIEMNLHAVLLA